MYYGGADSCVAVATASVAAIVDWLLTQCPPHEHLLRAEIAADGPGPCA